ncbi:glutamate/tyrosine decarboxylase-like PLP-dependent enzyme [Anseongella ginsenosidimutans]|uniref:Glutamate/tyrosine decarboxylase-like PLP-dependent enzyme n=1 Tax=Anseongella ginsenosidimutans TaxID=496056 RepID=A0A4R3KTV5_9SPHI|nr:pyridoxal-dependent decarboxylase [Anseongella ginsenosidimutans]QEC53491.1 aspartate aminotransferase family protein [Anseongella ginsenosidimutans]TCS88390.1 glutamate/tyrosine decarboxylase-like PLP-dependent enzyme [Anseongella ginsenosidimutans]
MDKVLKNDLEILEQLLETAASRGVSWLNKIDRTPTSVAPGQYGGTGSGGQRSSTKEGNGRVLDPEGAGGLEALNEFNRRFEPIMVASTGPRYWGFVTGGATPAAIVGDWLAAVYDQNTQTPKGPGDVSAVIELETINLLLQLFDLPGDFKGGFVSGAMMSNFTCLAVARQWAGRQLGRDVAREGVQQSLKVLSATPHSSAIKSLSLLGLGSANIVTVDTLSGNREAIDPAALEKAIQGLQGEPFILISSGGTVNTVDYDDLHAISLLKEKYRFWWHIDAAFGAFAALSPEHKHLLRGWENADSITIDAHKWLNVPYENAFFLVKEKHKTLQLETFRNSNAPYLGEQAENFNYLNYLPENSRRLKALPVWFTLLAYGRDGYRSIIENNILLARELGAYIEKSDDFQLLAPVRLNTVCFTLKAEPDRVPVFLERLNGSGKVFMTPTVYAGKAGIRAALVNWRTTADDVQVAIREMERAISV